MSEPVSTNSVGAIVPNPQYPAGVQRVPVATGLAMKNRNAVLVWLVWPMITLGIYHLVWYYKIHKEMAEFDRRRAVPVAGPLLVLLFLSWTFIAPLVSYYNAGNRIRTAQHAAGLRPTCSAGLGCFLMLVFGLGTLYYQLELNKITDAHRVPPGSQIPLYN
ncbi:DUF4234 domain-containing protein [Amycolatopsis sp., V23-08]|uniref:DUF4234 domain-containing protein n=1 Tax=Amycolatopsis heterodermiae TaxID=3110235 RepID=A0ABU5R1K4_9PSEU|nr:DUF4234 domain-containing protein [Amycolatopsis sp., V23-08]MEA5360091.1 DUF4234 domain-containing protein [Amycolatopsis sp., V23-08]